MKLSIIIVNWNTKMLLEKCLKSIVQSLKFKVQSEIIVVDNGSEDGSVEYVKSITGIKGTTGITRIKLIENKENQGFAKAVNQGIKQAEGETILLLNSDTQINLATLEQLLRFEEKVRPAIIGARLINPDGSIQASVFHLPTIKGAILEYWLGRKKAFSKYAPVSDKPVEVEAVSGGAMMISKEIIEKIGLLDERYFMYFEDLDYCRRAKKLGFKVFYLPTAEVVHEHGASGKNLLTTENQWRRLIPSSKIFNGIFKYHLINFIIRTGQLWRKMPGVL